MINQREYEKETGNSEQYGWRTVRPHDEHDFAIKNICAYVGPAMLYDSCLNGNYYAIYVEDRERVDEVRENFSRIEFVPDDFLACTKLKFYDKATLVKKYEEVINE